MRFLRSTSYGWFWLVAACALTCAVYAPGLSGGFLFDDYPNIVDNHGVQPAEASIASLARAAFSSPSSDFKRPLASLSFAANYLATGLDPFWMKLTNLAIHVLNGVLTFLLTRALLKTQPATRGPAATLAAWIAGGWMLLPINLTAVLYVVQRMESMANVFVLLGLLGYITARKRLAANVSSESYETTCRSVGSASSKAWLWCAASVTLPTVIGLLAKETAVMLPLYAALMEWTLFGFRRPDHQVDWRPIALFTTALAIPVVLGLAWLLPGILRPETWAARDFTLATRLLSEARIVTSYAVWTVLPLPKDLSFYHDDFVVSTGLFSPGTTALSICVIASLVWLSLWLRRRQPLMSLGIMLFLGCQLLTGTILPLELVYEHRNYFASFGLLLAIVPALAALQPTGVSLQGVPSPVFALPRRTLLLSLVLWWTTLTALTAAAWGSPLQLAEELAARAPSSPRAQYELGRTYIIYSRYNPASPFVRLAYPPLERAAALPDSSILPQQALIFMNSRMHLPVKDAWWASMVAKLRAKPLGVQDESSLGALTQCAREGGCNLPKAHMVDAFSAALSHPEASARLLAMYADYAWNVLGDHALGAQMALKAVHRDPGEPAYLITLAQMYIALGEYDQARRVVGQLQKLDIAGRLDESIERLRNLLPPNGT